MRTQPGPRAHRRTCHAGRPEREARRSRLEPLSRSGSLARLGPAAVLQLPQLPRFRRRHPHRQVRALGGCGPHVHGAGRSRRRRQLRRHLRRQGRAHRTGHHQPAPGISGPAGSAPTSTRRRPASSARASNSAARRATCESIARSSSFSRRSAAPRRWWWSATPIWWKSTCRTSWQSCRSRKLPKGDVALGHRSAQAAHLGNLSYEQRRRIHFDPDREIVLPA